MNKFNKSDINLFSVYCTKFVHALTAFRSRKDQRAMISGIDLAILSEKLPR
jgi:hypothetical protein